MAKVTPALLALVVFTPCLAHPGGLDSKGGHNDRKNGGYHYHRAAPSSTAPAAAPAPSPVTKQEPAPRISKEEFLRETGVATPTKEAPAPTDKPKPPKIAEVSPLAKITLGMTKAQVESAIGKPNVASENAWFYSAAGWVRFRSDVVFSIEAK